MFAGEPGDRTVITRRRWLRHEHLEGQLRQWAGWHDEKVLALDEVPHLTEERRIKFVGPRVIEGQRPGGTGCIRQLNGNSPGAFLALVVVPSRCIEAASKRGYL